MPYDLSRFLKAQETDYTRALAEIRKGRKASHWMWYIFPQIKGLGHSGTAQFYGLAGLGEAAEYLAHPVLGPRLVEITEAAVQHSGKTPLQIFGYPDNLKFHSCMTLFAQAPCASPVFRKALDLFFEGKEDAGTLRLLAYR